MNTTITHLRTTLTLAAAGALTAIAVTGLTSVPADPPAIVLAAASCRLVDASDLRPGDRILGPNGPETVTDYSEDDGYGGVYIATDNPHGGWNAGLPCPVKVLGGGR